ncbi:Lsr2 family DNA-binding protein [Dactylosporangium cerinum]
MRLPATTGAPGGTVPRSAPARSAGYELKDRGRLPGPVVDAYKAATAGDA